MIQKCYVRRRPKTGLGKNIRKRLGCVLVKNEWIGKLVVMIECKEYIKIKKQNKELITLLNNINKQINENIK